MAKRFYDTELFNKAWFRKLAPKYKTFWIYCLCNCDIAGILDNDFEAASFFIGEQITQGEVEEIFKKQLIKISEKKYFIPDFVEFQNGSELNPKSPVHKKIIGILEKNRLYDTLSNRVLDTQIVIVEVEEGVVVEEEVVVGGKDSKIFIEGAEKIYEELQNSKWLEKSCMNYKIGVSSGQEKLKEFLSKKELQEELTRPINDVKKHFINWLEIQIKNKALRQKYDPGSKIDAALSVAQQQELEIKQKYGNQ